MAEETGIMIEVPADWLERVIRESERYRMRSDLQKEEILDATNALGEDVKAWTGDIQNQLDTLSKEIKRVWKRVEEMASPNLEPDKKPVEESSTPKPEARPKPEKVGRKNVDDGKIRALWTGNWSIEKIADEMQLAPITVRRHLQEMGLLGK